MKHGGANAFPSRGLNLGAAQDPLEKPTPCNLIEKTIEFWVNKISRTNLESKVDVMATKQQEMAIPC
jgi:hypothetical protein